MRTEKCINAKAIILDAEEYNALETAEQVLTEMQSSLGGDNIIMSLETGEVITPGELARARAILSFVQQYRMVEVM